MGTSLPAILLAVSLAAAPAGAQEWKHAYETGDIFRALDILQPLVFEVPGVEHFEQRVDPMAAAYLATYYVNGWRVKQDLVVACGLTLMARRAAEIQRQSSESLKQATDALDRQTCEVITAQQRLDALAISGNCANLGLAGQIVYLEDGGWVEITQQNFIVDQGGRRTETSISIPCAQQVLAARYRKLIPPPDAAGHPRELVQLFAWYSGMVKGERRRHLMWTAWEVVDGVMVGTANEWIADEPGSAWPLHPVPDLVQFDFRYQRNGEVEYSVVNAAGERKRGELRPYDDLVKAARARNDVR